jgi:hypothetical protein
MTSPGSSKFAQLHANILARKGEARPWEEPANKMQWQREPKQALPPGSAVYTPPPFQPTQKPLFEAIAPRPAGVPESRPVVPPFEIKAVAATPEPIVAAPAQIAPASFAVPAFVAEPAEPDFAEVHATMVRRRPKSVDEMEFSDMSASEPSRPYDPEKIKKCTIRMSFIDYERLGIIAVKKNVTRQHLLHEALERCFVMAAEEYSKDCNCVGNRETCCQT